jgi:hypothetical protein
MSTELSKFGKTGWKISYNGIDWKTLEGEI